MNPLDYFKKTFVFVFVFIIVYKLVGQIFERFSNFTFTFILRTFVVALVTALVLGILNYFFKVGIHAKPNK